MCLGSWEENIVKHCNRRQTECPFLGFSPVTEGISIYRHRKEKNREKKSFDSEVVVLVAYNTIVE